MGERTPGPWRVEREPGGYVVRGHDGWMIAPVTAEANARFIAAAPDMEKALEYVISKGTIDMDDAMIDVVTAALAKAKGEANA